MNDRIKARRRWLAAGGAAVALGLAAVFGFRHDDRPQYIGARVQKGAIHDAVDATGTVNAVVTVQVGSQVSGTIAKLDADFNSHVRRGQVVALIEPSLLQGTLLQAAADLASARANVATAEAGLRKANAVRGQAKAEYERVVQLAKVRAMTEQELDAARAGYETATASVDAAAAGVVQAKAQVSQKAAAVSVARTNVDHAVIRSPIDGVVVARNVDVGQTVAASLQAPTIFTIAQDLTQMRVYAKVDESDVGRIRLGQPVTFKVDAFPRDQFEGTIGQVRMNPTTVQNVVTYDAIIDFRNPERKLFPGMTAYVTIPVATARDVVKLPNAALRFKPPMPPEEIRALYARSGIDDGRGAQRESAVVWKLRPDHTIEPVKVALGITDHAFTEVSAVLAGTLAPDDEVVTTSVAATSGGPGNQPVRR